MNIHTLIRERHDGAARRHREADDLFGTRQMNLAECAVAAHARAAAATEHQVLAGLLVAIGETETAELLSVGFAVELCVGLADDGLDGLVHDTASTQASSVNNEGFAGQIAYLIEQHGHDEAVRLIKELA